MKTSAEIKEYYNDYSENQSRTGVNLRHYFLINLLINFGLKKNHMVLEIGCGIGTLSGLLHSYLKKGKLVATDISDRSIEIAKTKIKNSESIDFINTDMNDFVYPNTFDFIVLPDVLEHIPIEQHKNLFKNLSAHIHDESIIVINIPHPKVIEFLKKFSPEKLQVIDQSINSDILLNNIYSNGLILESYKSYSLFHDKHDYALIKLKKNNFINFSPISKYKIIWRKLIQRIKFIISIV